MSVLCPWKTSDLQLTLSDELWHMNDGILLPIIRRNASLGPSGDRLHRGRGNPPQVVHSLVARQDTAVTRSTPSAAGYNFRLLLNWLKLFVRLVAHSRI